MQLFTLAEFRRQGPPRPGPIHRERRPALSRPRTTMISQNQVIIRLRDGAVSTGRQRSGAVAAAGGQPPYFGCALPVQPTRDKLPVRLP